MAWQGKGAALISLFMMLSLCKLALGSPPQLKITACDVGQGDAAVLSYGQSHILIDTGPNNDVLECLRLVIFWADPVLDAVVITHSDHDHAGGLAAVTDRYRVKQWMVNPTDAQELDLENTDIYDEYTPVAGEALLWPGWRLRVVWSELTRGSVAYPPERNANQDSIGLQLHNQSFGFLTLGDLECRQELAVAGMGLLNPTHFLKISHHGAKTSSCPGFLQWLTPEAAYISSGANNSYGHPAPQTLQNIANIGIFLWRTDVSGSLQWGWNEGRWSVRPLLRTSSEGKKTLH